VNLFSKLFQDLDQTTSTLEKIDLVAEYLVQADPHSAAWGLYFLTGRRTKRLISSRDLQGWALTYLNIPQWLFEESYARVGDTAETIALLSPLVQSAAPQGARMMTTPHSHILLHEWMENRILPMQKKTEVEKQFQVTQWWRELPPNQIFLLNKLLTGGLRIGVSETLAYRACEKAFHVPRALVTHRLLGEWTPSPTLIEHLRNPETSGFECDVLMPYPFYLAAPLEDKPSSLGPIQDWQVEWKWDGIRCQAIHREGQVKLWSRGEETITPNFPDLALAVAKNLPDGVYDGEILAWDDSARQPRLFADLQKRLGRKKPSANFTKENSAALMLYDCLELNDVDLRNQPIQERRALLVATFENSPASPFIKISDVIEAKTWDELEVLRVEARQRRVEGMMLKKKSSAYGVGRKRGDWWKWKVDPLTMDAVLTYAQPGSGRRAALYTDYTFSVWKDEQLVTIAKAYSGLTDVEINELDRWIRRNTTEKFGPVRSVKPELVFEIAFEAIAQSKRHKSGWAVRFPRILRQRTDKHASEADTIERLSAIAKIGEGLTP
jgi:DNA ligase-1